MKYVTIHRSAVQRGNVVQIVGGLIERRVVRELRIAKESNGDVIIQVHTYSAEEK